MAGKSGASAARNWALDAAAGRILLFINDDIIAEDVIVAEHLRRRNLYPETTKQSLAL